MEVTTNSSSRVTGGGGGSYVRVKASERALFRNAMGLVVTCSVSGACPNEHGDQTKLVAALLSLCKNIIKQF